MRITGLIIVALAALAFVTRRTPVSSAEQELVEKAVLDWADQTFEYYDGPRFEKFVMIPSDQYAILEGKVESLTEYREELKQNFASGEMNKTKEEFDKTLGKLDRKIDSLNTLKNNVSGKATGYEIDFWANIMVNNALTVYYVHHMKLGPDYAIKDAKITGSIGKENDQIKILYKSGKGGN